MRLLTVTLLKASPAFAALVLTALAAPKAAVTDLPDTGDAPCWELISDRTTATVYNAVPSQCNEDCLHTASMYTIVPENIEKERILAMERTMMAEFDIHYGDTVLVSGTGRYDGLWQVQDTMNKRFAGQHKIDFLVPQYIRHGKWEAVKIYKQTKPKDNV